MHQGSRGGRGWRREGGREGVVIHRSIHHPYIHPFIVVVVHQFFSGFGVTRGSRKSRKELVGRFELVVVRRCGGRQCGRPISFDSLPPPPSPSPSFPLAPQHSTLLFFLSSDIFCESIHPTLPCLRQTQRRPLACGSLPISVAKAKVREGRREGGRGAGR